MRSNFWNGNENEKPRILLSGKARIENYIKAVEAVGAEAVAECLPKIDTGYDGLILCGVPRKNSGCLW